MVIIDARGHPLAPPARAEAAGAVCVFEYVYFARPDSKLGGRSVYEVRKALGERSREEHPVDADVVIPRARLGRPGGHRLRRRARRSPSRWGSSGRTTSAARSSSRSRSIRHFGVRLKLNPVEPVLRGKRVVVIDDSIVRGTTSRKIVKMVRDAGAREVHLRISSPPTQWPCYYGIDTPTRRELIASSHSVDEIARYVTADSLGYLSLEGMLRAAVSGPAATANGTATRASRAQYAIPFTPTSKRQMRLVGV